MAASITEITRIQRLIKEFRSKADTHPQGYKFLQQIEKSHDSSTFISLEALQGLDEERQQALANLLSDLIDKMFLSQAWPEEEEKRLQEIVRYANSQQQESKLQQSEEKHTGLSLIESGRCALISLEAFNSLDLNRQERLAIFIGREHLQKTLSEKDERAMKNLVQLGQLRQETAAIKLNASPSPLTAISSSSFFPGISFILPPSSADAQKSLDDHSSNSPNNN